MIEKRKSYLFRLITIVALTLVCITPRWDADSRQAVGAGLKPNLDPPDEILVKLRGVPDENSTRHLFAQRDLGVIKHIPRINVWVMASLDPHHEESAAALARHLEQSNDVLWAEPNGQVHATGTITPNDNFYAAQQWNLRQIRLPEAWYFGTGDATIIAVLDTGIDLDHPDLAAKMWTNPGEVPDNGVDDDGNGYVDDVHGWNFVAGSTLLVELPHGTHVAGIAGAHTNNGIGVAGVNWQSPIMPLQVLRSTNTGTFDDLAEAIVYAADNGARVLNLSLGGDNSSQTVDAAIAYARSQDCLLVASVGNDDAQPYPVLYPANSPKVMAVAATTDSDAPASFSNRGPEVDVAAPGADVFSTSAYGQYAQMSGTSQAVPHVSGLAALVLSLQPTLTADQVTHVITSTAHDVHTPGWDQRTGWGRIDALATILAFESYRMYLPLVGR